MALNSIFNTALICCCHSHVGSCNPCVFADEPGLPVPHSVPLCRAHPPGVASSTHAAAVTEEEQQGEQDQRPPGKNTQQHQQQDIVLRLARGHRHILMKSSQEKRSGPQQQYIYSNTMLEYSFEILSILCCCMLSVGHTGLFFQLHYI